MVKASGVTYAHLICTAETWEQLADLCTPGGSFSKDIGIATSALRSCTPVARDDGLVRVRLTGPQLAEVPRGKSGSMPKDALATRIHDQASKMVDRIDLEAEHGKPVDDIVIDARLGTE